MADKDKEKQEEQEEQEAKITQDVRKKRPSGEPNQDSRTPSGRLP